MPGNRLAAVYFKVSSPAINARWGIRRSIL